MEILLIFTLCLIIAGTDAVTTVIGYRGRSVQINCSYDSGYEKSTKYLCRGGCSVVLMKDIPVDSGPRVKDPRFSLYDDTTAKVFTVNITDLRTEDAGTYWCGVQGRVYDSYTKILLQVKTDDSALNTVLNTTHSTSVQASAVSPSLEIANPLSTANHSVITSSSQEMSPIITAVSVVLVLLLFALLFAVVLQRKKKIQAQPAQSSSTRKVVPCPDYDYEEVKDSRRLSNTLYSTALPRPVPSEINTGLPTVPSGYAQDVYSTVDHPSDPPDQDFYCTAQLPTIPSDSLVRGASPSVGESEESLMYAAVSFDTRLNAAAPTVIFKNENNSCEYATVNRK